MQGTGSTGSTGSTGYQYKFFKGAVDVISRYSPFKKMSNSQGYPLKLYLIHTVEDIVVLNVFDSDNSTIVHVCLRNAQVIL